MIRSILKYFLGAVAALPLVFHSNPQKATLLAVGDIMMHRSTMSSAYNEATRKYDFSPYFTDVKPILQQGDFVIGNLETRFAGKDKGYTGFPLFNAPEQLAFDLRNAGFTLLTTANNHSLDMGLEGIVLTNDNIGKADLLQTGTFTSEEDRNKIRILEHNGISLAVFAYTERTNGIPIPMGKEYSVNLIDFQRMRDDFYNARRSGADIIVCSLHFGDEYEREPNKRQKDIVKYVFDLGADIILGSHPHVVQSYETREIGKRKCVVAYSLGNFISGQTFAGTDVGEILQINIEKTGKNVEISSMSIPTRLIRCKTAGRLLFSILPVGGISGG